MNKANEIGVLAQYDWIQYRQPKKAMYIPVSDKYSIEKGWAGDPIEVLVIGEDEMFYVTGTKTTDAEWWQANKTPIHTVQIPIGFHKSRLIGWLPMQLSLF